jgi:hypothetical protein
MNQSTPPAPPANHAGCDSLTADLVLADDRGNFTVLPADPEALASFLAECRRLENLRSAPKKPDSES